MIIKKKKKNKYNLLNTRKNKKIEQEFLNTNVGKAIFVVLVTGIITIVFGFGVAIFEGFLYLTDSNISDYNFLISLGCSSVITGLICNLLYIVVYTNYRNKK